jgi:MFS family permease
MYFSDQQQVIGTANDFPRVAPWLRTSLVSGNVLLLGLTSMFTDISSEMVTAALPIYLTFELRLTALQFGLFDGLYQGMSVLLRLVGGLFADRHRRYKEVATVGYAVSAGCKLGLLIAQSAWLTTTACLFLDRLGKGIRTAPRDSLISLSSSRNRRAEAFGVHRALDTAGALLGPLVAFTLLGLFPGTFSIIFVVSFGMGLLGLAILVLFVENQQPDAHMDSTSTNRSWRFVLSPLGMTSFRRLFLAAALLSLLSISDAFIYLTFQRLSNLNISYFPLLYLGTALIYLTLAIPLGRLADRVGRQRVFLGGYVGLLTVYIVLLLPQLGMLALLACLMLFGTYYAATEGVLVALASALLPAAQLTSGLALLTTATILSRLVASILYGALWSWQGPQMALSVFIVGLAIAMTCTAFTLLRHHPEPEVE